MAEASVKKPMDFREEATNVKSQLMTGQPYNNGIHQNMQVADSNYFVYHNSMQRNITSPEQYNFANMSNPSSDSLENRRHMSVLKRNKEIRDYDDSPKLMPSQPKVASSQKSTRAAADKGKASATASRATSLVTRFRVGKRDSQPPEDTGTYQGLDVTKFMSNLPQRRFRRRAVVIGINYVLTPDLLLRGGCNDASAMALALINLYDFLPEDIVLLIDAIPVPCYRQASHDTEGEKSGENVPWKNRRPTRRNILLALNWLRAGAIAGDVLLFFFAGHGVQVDDMSGWEGEGYDEAVLPMDFHGDETYVITAVMIRNLLLNVASDVQVTIILDCNGGQTMLDPAGTGKWNFIKGIKQRGVWPFVTDATDKVARAVYDKSAWMDKTMKKRGARPRFMPGVDVRSTKDLLDPTLQKPSAHDPAKVKGYLFAAAPWSQSAIEAKMTGIRIIPITRDNTIIKESHYEKHFAYHGVFTWCFITALQELLKQGISKYQTKSVSFRRILAEVERRIKVCKSPQGGLPKLDQCPELTFYRTGGSDQRDFFLWPFGGRRSGVTYADGTPEMEMQLPCIPHEQQYLSIWEAEEQLREAGENRRKNDPIFMRSATLSSSPAYVYGRNASNQRLISAPQPDMTTTSPNVEELTDLSASTGLLRSPTSPGISNFAQMNSSRILPFIPPKIVNQQETDFNGMKCMQQPINNVQMHQKIAQAVDPNSVNQQRSSQMQQNFYSNSQPFAQLHPNNQNILLSSNPVVSVNASSLASNRDLMKGSNEHAQKVQSIPNLLFAKQPHSYLSGSSMKLPNLPIGSPAGPHQRAFPSIYSTRVNASQANKLACNLPEDFAKQEYTNRLIMNSDKNTINQFNHLTEKSLSTHQAGLAIKTVVKNYMK